MKGKRGAGRDRIPADKFYRNNKDSFPEYALQCRNGEYRFSVYNERLELKGRGKTPRVISIPTMRDRLVLGNLNRYLQEVLPDCIERRPVNQLIGLVQKYIIDNKGKEIKFFKTDFSGFYDNIDRKLLMELLEKRNVDSRALTLIKRAIETPTCGGSRIEAMEARPEEYGIPQGLSISNILSFLYLSEFDKTFRHDARLYIRYVDDILMLDPNKPEAEISGKFQDLTSDSSYRLIINKEKTLHGLIGKDELNFLGYSIGLKNTSVKRSNVTSFLNRLAKECHIFKRQYRNRVLRPKYLQDNEAFVKTRIFLLNQSLTGIKIEEKYYGWLHHYQQLTDIGLLRMIDRKIRNQFLDFLPKKYKGQLRTLTHSFYLLLEGKIDKVVFDYDSISLPEEQRAYLIRRGLLDEEKEYSEGELEILYLEDRDRIRKRNELNIGKRS